MTINYKDQLRLPSYSLFLICYHTKKYPWSIRARVIKTFRKMVQKGIKPPLGLEPFELPQPREYGDVLVEEPFKTAKEKKREEAKRKAQRLHSKKEPPFDQNQGSRRNAKTRNALRSVTRWTSAGKDRPSKKRKLQYVATRFTLHLKGNRWSGGQDEF